MVKHASHEPLHNLSFPILTSRLRQGDRNAEISCRGELGGTVDRDTSDGSTSSLGLFCFDVVVVVVWIRVSDRR